MMEQSARVPSATYRLQFHAGFTFRDALAIVDYLSDLGISDVYASPYFQAAPDSTHGYDVADHNRLNIAIGDDSDYRAFVSELRSRGMGQVLDFVPNHMGIGQSLNTWWREVLEDGLASPYARYFDIDWHPGKRELAGSVLLPILGERYGQVLEKGEFKLAFDNGAFSLHYYETDLPISPRTYSSILRPVLDHVDESARKPLLDVLGLLNDPAAKVEVKSRLRELAEADSSFREAVNSRLRELEGVAGDARSFDALHDLLEAQSYRLSYWRTAAEEINYRRFFDINTLAAIRVEIPEVFEAAHQLVFTLMARGDISGLRIDHVDGLWDPKKYLQRLQDRYRELCGGGENGLYLLVEKILDPLSERFPADWPSHGTTGYEFANQAVQVLVDSRNEKRFSNLYQSFTDEQTAFQDLVYEKKKLTMQNSLSSEVVALGRMLNEISEIHRNYRDFTLASLTTAVREMVACFPVYRIYPNDDGTMSAEDEKIVLRAVLAARKRNRSIEKALFDFIRNVLLLRLPETLSEDERLKHLEFVRKFQQCSGPVMAKGLEDTAFYIYNRLVALNEVGGNPGQFGIDVRTFHRLNAERCELTPHSMLATSTHDTKRSEDVRMRIAALSEMPALWKESLKRWSTLNRKYRTRIDDLQAPSRNEEYLLYQTLLGTWVTASGADRSGYKERIQQYMLKALKEAKINSSWTEPNEDWEAAVSNFVSDVLDEAKSAHFLEDLNRFAGTIARVGAMNSLAQQTLKATLPGVPDFYQGTEVWDLSLVDPDNRRPVDYEERRKLLHSSSLTPLPDLLADWHSGGVKIALTKRLLCFRRDHAAFFRDSDYRPVLAQGVHAERIIAFERRLGASRLLVVVPRLTAVFETFPTGDSWGDTQFPELEGTDWRNILLDQDVPASEKSLAGLLSAFPVAVLYRGE